MQIRAISAALTLFVGLALPMPTVLAAEESAPPPAALPALPTAWQGTDYEQAVSAISRGKVPLPRLASPESAPLFARLVSEDNLRLPRDKSLSLDVRRHDLGRRMGASFALLDLYVAESGKSDVSAEMVALVSIQLRLMASAADMMGEFVPLTPPESHDMGMRYLEQFKSSLAGMLLFAEGMLDELKWSGEQQARVLDAMADSIDAMVPFLAPKEKQQLAGKLAQRRPRANAEGALAIDRLLQSLRP